ncbi:denticleless protein homolog isoform X1 [Alligator mississippiensis]|uniref:Denticleless protein-like protein isoform B n=2 Tax=Alligator mississippiensis TaxID=8496 RepID=A0A151P3K9_ALLMI|nr:denticleless protein homolog isoform X1 [Alligator mississippiensis]KYO43636.1 denticleless protein-like protein isoform B [Alligator mississippiensis]
MGMPPLSQQRSGHAWAESYSRRIGGPSWQYSLQHLIDCYQCSQQDDHLSYGELGMPVPPFGCTFPTAPDLQHILAVANEEGFVRLYDTESQTKQIFKEWLAHSNAVFDIAWVPGEHRIVTASGDQTAKVWDVRAGELLGICKGHQCSLKSVAFSKFERAVFCTGGRDGNVMVWDTRVNKKDGYYRQVNQIGGAHNVADKQMPSKPKKKKQNLRGLAPSVDFQQSVTVVLLQDEHTLISAGAVDGIIKVWDLRKNYSIYRQDPVPFKSYCYPGISTRKLGYSSLILDSTGTHLFANCTDDSIYLFNMTSLKTMPAAVFSGHQNSTFYVKSSISPDDQFLVSGSSDQSAYIWKISEPQLPPRMLLGHSQEVTSVAWCPSDFTKIATCSDDNTVRVWRLNRGSEEKNPASDHVNLVGWVCQKKLNEQSATGLPVSRENTPAKFPMTSNPCTSSPRQAACAPSCLGDLPLSTNTPASSLKIPTAKAHTPAKQNDTTLGISPKQASCSKMSITHWVTRTPCSSLPETGIKTPSPRRALTDVTQSVPEAICTPRVPHLHSVKRAKRRLESSKEDHLRQKCLKGCSCVTELDPMTKKSKLNLCLLGAGHKTCSEDCLCLAELNSGLESCSQNPKEPSPPESPLSPAGFQTLPFETSYQKVADMSNKENSSPENKDWLSALGEKLKTNKARSQNSSGSSTPSSRTRRQEAVTAVTPPRPVAADPVPMRKICTYFRRKSQNDSRGTLQQSLTPF